MNKFCILLLMVAFSASVHSQSQLLTLYENAGCTGAAVTINDYSPNLANQGFDNRARSARLTGVWLFYDNREFNPQDAAMEYAFEPVNRCVNFQAIGGYISSVRYAGSSTDYRSDTITLFDTLYFQGQEEYMYTDFPNLALYGKVKSLIVTGSSSLGWTLYDRPNYAGNAVCVFPPPSGNIYEPALITDTRSISVPHNAIASVRRGCHGVQTGTQTRVANVVSAPFGVHQV